MIGLLFALMFFVSLAYDVLTNAEHMRDFLVIVLFMLAVCGWPDKKK